MWVSKEEASDNMNTDNLYLLVIAIVVIAAVPVIWQVHRANEREKRRKANREAVQPYGMRENMPLEISNATFSDVPIPNVVPESEDRPEPIQWATPAPSKYSGEGPKKGKDGKERWMIYELDAAGHKHLLFTHLHRERHLMRLGELRSKEGL